MAEATTHAASTEVRHPRRWLVLVVVLSATFMQLLDVSIVGVAIASIQQTLSASYADTQLVLVGYQIGFAAMLILSARLGDMFGRKRLFLIGMAAFTLASVACGLAPMIEILLVARVLQGVASALMFSQVLAIIQVIFEPDERGGALGAYGATIGLGTVLGPVAGGLLIKADFVTDAWRPIFLVNVPIGVVAFLAAVVLLPESTAPRRTRLDVIGAVLSAAGLGALLYALSEGRGRGWPVWLLALLASGVAALTVFTLYENHLARTGRDPILDVRLFADRAFGVGSLLNVVFYAGVPGFFLVFSLYLQVGQGFSALGAGLLGMIATAALAGSSPQIWHWIPAMAVSGLGFGLFVPSVIDLVLVNVDRARAGIASGALATMQQVGGALGVTLLGILFFGLLSWNTPTSAEAGERPMSDIFAVSFTEALSFQVGVYVLVLVLTAALPRVTPRRLAETRNATTGT